MIEMAATGAAVIRYPGVRGDTWTIRYIDSTGKRVRERLPDAAADGTKWTRRKARAEIESRLVEVRKQGYRKPTVVTFDSFVDGWVDRQCDARALKRSARASYTTIVELHLRPAFGRLRLDDITVERIEEHLDAKRKKGAKAATLHRQLATLSLIFRAAHRRGLVRENPVPLVERPRDDRRKWRILSPAEVGAVEQAFAGLIEAAETDRDRDDLRTSRVLFLTFMAAG